MGYYNNTYERPEPPRCNICDEYMEHVYTLLGDYWVCNGCRNGMWAVDDPEDEQEND